VLVPGACTTFPSRTIATSSSTWSFALVWTYGRYVLACWAVSLAKAAAPPLFSVTSTPHWLLVDSVAAAVPIWVPGTTAWSRANLSPAASQATTCAHQLVEKLERGLVHQAPAQHAQQHDHDKHAEREERSARL
jgi:hypothetical protein